MGPNIYSITCTHNGLEHTVEDIWLTEDEGGDQRAINEAIFLLRDSVGLKGAVTFKSMVKS